MSQSPLACVGVVISTGAALACERLPKASRMTLTAQFAAQTPKPSEAITVEKRTSVATSAFKFGPPLIRFKYAFYSNLRSQFASLAAAFSTLAALTLRAIDR